MDKLTELHLSIIETDADHITSEEFAKRHAAITRQKMKEMLEWTTTHFIKRDVSFRSNFGKWRSFGIMKLEEEYITTDQLINKFEEENTL